MQVNKIDTTNFQGIYRIANTPRNVSEIQKYVTPMYEQIRHEKSFLFEGFNPFKQALDIILNEIADGEKYSLSWLKMNAENFGADFSKIGDGILHIITGKKDISRVFEHMKNRAFHKPTVLEQIKEFFSRPEEDYSDKPEHLRLLFHALDVNKEEDNAFYENFGDEIIEVKTPQDLLTKMLCEKL